MPNRAMDANVKHAVNNVLFCNNVSDENLDEFIPKQKFLTSEIVNDSAKNTRQMNGILGMIIVAT